MKNITYFILISIIVLTILYNIKIDFGSAVWTGRGYEEWELLGKE